MKEMEILTLGTAIAALGALLLGAVVAELSRTARLAKPILSAALGLGVLSFGAKLVLIVGFGHFGGDYLAYALPNEPRRAEPPTTPTVVKRPDTRHRHYTWQALPRSAPYPADNPTTAAKVALGRRLFSDPRLSADDRVACADCHDLRGKGGADGRPQSIGIAGQRGARNAPTVLNAAFQSVLFWDGRAASLEEQALGPITNPVEMGMPSLQAVEAKLNAIDDYRRPFAQAFGDGPITATNIARAIAAYERTLITPDTRYDRFVRGDAGALTEQQLRGMALFARLGCVACHSGPNFSGASLFPGNAPYRTFPSRRGTEFEARYRLTDDTGRRVNGVDNPAGVWRIPSLRNVTRTAPYFHNGAVEELREAVRIMARVQLDQPLDNRPENDWRVTWSPTDRTLHATPDAALSDAEIDDIVAFLHALEG